MASKPSPGPERQFVRMDTWFQANIESPGSSRGASPRTPRRLSDGEGLFGSFDEDARWDGADRAPTPSVLRPPTPVAERAAAAPEPQAGGMWGSLLGIVAPPPARAVAERGQTADAVLEHAAVLVQRLLRGKIARLDAKEVTRRFKLLELYARAEEKAAMVIQRSQRHRHRCRLERAAVRVEAAARGRIARQSIPPKVVPVSGAYCIPREADDVTGSDLDLTSLRGPVFKRSRGWPRYQLRYMYMSVDGAGQVALCHRASDAVGGGTGIEKQLPVASITAVHVESWGRYVFSVHSQERGVSSCRRFRCHTLDDLVRWSNALSLSLCPPPVTEAQLGLAKDSYRGLTGTEALRAPRSPKSR